MHIRRLRGWLMRLFGLFDRGRREQEFAEELESHLAFHIEDNLRAGMSPEEARRQARIKLGGVTLTTELHREQGGLPMLETLLQDLRFGVRMLIKQPGFSLIAILTLALGIGANTAIFSVVDALLLRPLPYHDSERLVLLSEKPRQSGRANMSYPNYSDWRERAQSFEEMASIRNQFLNLTGVDNPVQLRGRTVNWNFFHLLGVQPQLGRSFTREDDQYGAARMALLSHGMWQERFGGEAGIIGRKLLLDGEPYEVIGVLPPGFEYFRADDVYVPIGLFLDPQGLMQRSVSMGLYAVARLKPGVTVEQASAELAGIAAQLEREYPAANSGRGAQAEPLQNVMSEGVRQSLWILLGSVGFILLIACVNVANLLLVRASERQKEIALRLALGAGRGRIVRQLLCESLLLALLGGVLGVLVGRWLLAGLLALAPNNIPQLARVSLSDRVLLFTLTVSVLTSMLCGLLPAWHALGTDLRSALNEGGRSSAGAAREITRKILLVAEVSLAMVLLIGAGLLVRSMARALSVDPGFNPDHLLTMRFKLPSNVYSEARRRVFYDECVTHVSALPGVRSAALTVSLPIDGSEWGSGFTVADKPAPTNGVVHGSAATHAVSANYFATMGIRLVKGRMFTSADTPDTPRISVINERFARQMWPGEDPLGKRWKFGTLDGPSPWREIIGVVTDVKLNGVESETPLEVYLPLAQQPRDSLALVVRTEGEPLQSAATVERTIHTIDKDLPVFAIRSMDQLLGSSMAQRRLTLVLLASFAVLALLLAAVGIYGVISYVVRKRTHELGIRMALGAESRDVLWLVIGQGMRLALAGLTLGLAGAWAVTRLMKTLLFGVSATDPLTFAVIPVLLLGLALLACYIPARRATKVDPLIALRHE